MVLSNSDVIREDYEIQLAQQMGFIMKFSLSTGLESLRNTQKAVYDIVKPRLHPNLEKATSAIERSQS